MDRGKQKRYDLYSAGNVRRGSADIMEPRKPSQGGIKKTKIPAEHPRANHSPKVNINSKIVQKPIPVKNAPMTNNTTSAAPKQINISVSLPSKIHLPKLKIPKTSRSKQSKAKSTGLWLRVRQIFGGLGRKRLILGLAALFVIVSGVALTVNILNKPNNKKPTVGGASADAPKPSFPVLYSSNKPDKVSYDNERKVASYPDKLSGVDLIISQQNIPNNFKTDPVAGVAKLAKDINANTKLDIGGFEAYLGQSIKGPQTVVFTKDGSLVFIKSAQTITKEEWIKYLGTLKSEQ